MMISTRERGYGLKCTPQSLLNHLKRKLQNPSGDYPLIPELNGYGSGPEDIVCKYNDLLGIPAGDDECCFFYPLRGRNVKGIDRLTPEGYWHVTGPGKEAPEGDETKWVRKNLVYYLGKQSNKIQTDWAMQEYMIESDPSFLLYHIHKKRRNKRKKKSDSDFSELGSPSGASVGSEEQDKRRRISPGVFEHVAMKPQIPTPLSDIDASVHSTSSPRQSLLPVPENLQYPTSSPPQGLLPVPEILYNPSDTSIDSTESPLSSYPQIPQMYQESFNGSGQYLQDIVAQSLTHGSVNSQPLPQIHYPQHVPAESSNFGLPYSESPHQNNILGVFLLCFTFGLLNILSHPNYQFLRDLFPQLLSSASSNLLQQQCLQATLAQLNNFMSCNFISSPRYDNPQDVSALLVNCVEPLAPLQYREKMATAEMYPSAGIKNCNNSSSHSQVPIYGQDRARQIYFQEHLGNVVGSQTSIQPFSAAFSPELLKVNLQSDGSAGSPQNAVPAAENRVSQQANGKETRDFATESSEDNGDFDISQFLISSLDLVSYEVDMIGGPQAAVSSDTQVQPQETTSEVSVVTTVESQDTTPPFGADLAEYSTSFPHQTQMMVADEFLSEDVYTDGYDSIQLADIPPCSPNLMREQSPCLENTFIHGCDQEYSTRWSYPQDGVTPDEGASINILYHNPTSQLPDDVVPGSISPPQQPSAMHTEEISPHYW